MPDSIRHLVSVRVVTLSAVQLDTSLRWYDGGLVMVAVYLDVVMPDSIRHPVNGAKVYDTTSLVDADYSGRLVW